MAQAKLPANVQKCATCDRWSGNRRHGADAIQVEFDDQETQGRCMGGPWDGNVRDPLTRCGRWIIWVPKL